jgi:plastocyanin
MKLIRSIITMMVILVLAAACTPAAQTNTNSDSSTTPSGGSEPAAGTTFEGTATIEMKNFSFSPEIATVKIGTEVTWINMDGASHNVTADDNSFTSQQLSQNDSFKFVFNQPGTYTYTCTTHPSMKGTIIVVQ